MAKEDEYLQEFDNLIEKYANRDVQGRIKNLKRGKEAYKEGRNLERPYPVISYLLERVHSLQEEERNLSFEEKVILLGYADKLLEMSLKSPAAIGELADVAEIYQKIGKGYNKKKIIEAVKKVLEIQKKYPNLYAKSTTDDEDIKTIREYLATPSKSQKGLEKKLIGLISGASLIVALFFLSSNITGNVVGNLNQTSSNWIGGILFILGIVGLAVSFRR